MIEDYPQFSPTDPPDSSGAVRAWKGIIRPFPSVAELGPIIADLEQGRIVDIEVGGGLVHSNQCTSHHGTPVFLSRLVRMQEDFSVVVLEFNYGKHRQAYCLSPEISRRTLPWHPHLRDDLPGWFGRWLPAICPYRSDEVSISPGVDGMVKYLDYVSIYLAKHLIWLRTADFKCKTDGYHPRIVYTPPNGMGWLHGVNGIHVGKELYDTRYTSTEITRILASSINGGAVHGWEGIWVGDSAPHDLPTYVATILPASQCHCGSGKRYAACHRKEDIEAVGQRFRAR